MNAGFRERNHQFRREQRMCDDGINDRGAGGRKSFRAGDQGAA
jgi:hypothetical protein